MADATTSTVDSGQGIGIVPSSGGTNSSASITNQNAINAGEQKNSPTVMTDANIRENVIPTVLQNASKTLPPPTSSTQSNQSNGSGGTVDNRVTDVAGDTLDPASPTYYSDLYKSLSTNADNDSDATSELSMLDNMKTANDASTQSSINALQQSYADRTNTLKTAQGNQTRALTNSLIMSGAARYSPITTNTILSSKETNDASAISDLQDKENQAIATAQTAQQNNDYKTLSAQISIINSLRTQKNALATSLTTDMNTNTKAIQTSANQAKRDDAVAGLVEEGITDPDQILTTLNDKDPNAGYTAAEVQTVLKDLSPTGDLTGLTGEVKNFYTLKGTKQLPSSISSLPDDQQLAAYLKYVKTSSAVSGTSAGATTKITLTTAKTLGLPLATVGMTQDDIMTSLQSETPAPWFIEKLGAQTGATVNATSATTIAAWNTYRNSLIGGNIPTTSATEPMSGDNASSTESVY